LTIHGERHYLWRAVDQNGHVLDILVQHRQEKKAAKKFFRKLLKGCRYVPRVIVTDQRKSYGPAKPEMLPGVEHRQHRYLNNGEKIPINRRSSGNGGCRGIHPQDTPSAFFLPVVPSRHTSARGATDDSRPQRIARRCVNDSRSGGKSRRWLLPHKHESGDSCLPAGLVMHGSTLI
jgi:hypothetical protein